jgi:uncharacterized protein YwbE
MTTIDNIMALADEYAGRSQLTEEGEKLAREALRAALTDALVLQTNKPAWKCTGDGLKRFLTQSQYDAQPENIKVWYEPFSAPIHSPILTIGHCKEKAQPGGCQLHNLQCGYPVCDHKPA